MEDLDETVHEQEIVEYFPVVRSNWEMHHQDGLNKCYKIQVRRKKVQLRVEHKPGSISDDPKNRDNSTIVLYKVQSMEPS